ncbi:hypothetical protein L0F63_007006 [Massospora cicadina]|nr:hypothetical protein L0F63_007006 [Massospora cicadina]
MASKAVKVMNRTLPKAYGWGSFVDRLFELAYSDEISATRCPKPDYSTPQELNFGTSEKVGYSHIAAGYQHGFIAYEELGAKARLCGFGLNTSGQLGLGKPSPLECGFVPGVDEVAEIQCGREHSFIRTGSSDKPVERLIEPSFRDLGLRFPIRQIACGLDHSILLSEDGLFAMGWGADGQLGLGKDPPVNQDAPTPIPLRFSPKEIKKVSSSHDCTLLLLESGKVYSWGNSEYGQGMHGEKLDRVLEATPISFDEKVVDVAAGGSFSLLLSETGKVFVCGFGVLGLGERITETLIPTEIPTLRDVRSIFASSGTACAINDCGEALMWGLGSPVSRRLGLGTACNHAYTPQPLKLPYHRLKVETVALGGHFGLLLGSD